MGRGGAILTNLKGKYETNWWRGGDIGCFQRGNISLVQSWMVESSCLWACRVDRHQTVSWKLYLSNSEILGEPCGGNWARGHTRTAKRKKAREKRSSGTTSLDLDASQWLKGVNKQGKFDGGLIAKYYYFYYYFLISLSLEFSCFCFVRKVVDFLFSPNSTWIGQQGWNNLTLNCLVSKNKA